MKIYSSYGELRYGSWLDIFTVHNILLLVVGVCLYLGQSTYLTRESDITYCDTSIFSNVSDQRCYPAIRVEKGTPFKVDTEEWILENGVKSRRVSSYHDYNLDKINFVFWVGTSFALAALIGFIRDRIVSAD